MAIDTILGVSWANIASVAGVAKANITSVAGVEVPSSFTGLFDTVTSPSIGGGVRRLSSSYTGSLMRIIRASDSSEQDIGYDGSGNLDTSAIASFCSGTTGYVGILYDQSGNGYDAIGKDYGVNLSSLPIIYESGSVTTLNGVPAIKITHPRVFQWVATGVPFSAFCSGGASGSDKAITTHFVGQQSSSPSDPYKIIIDGSSQGLWFYQASGAERTDFLGTSASSGATFTDDAQKNWVWLVNGNTFSWHENNSTVASSSNFSAQTPSESGPTITIGGLSFSSRNIEGYIQEFAIWKTAKSVSDIYTDADAYYSFP